MCGNQRYWLPWKLLWIWFLMWFIRNIIIPPNTWMCLVDSWSIVWLNFDKWVKYLSNFNETIDQPSKWVKYLHLHVKPSHFREETGPLQSWQFSKELIFTLIIFFRKKVCKYNLKKRNPRPTIQVKRCCVLNLAFYL